MKLKSVIVIILSSVLISAVILLTIFGLSLFMGWKERESSILHKESLSLLNARRYSRYLDIQDMQPKFEKRGLYKGECALEGSIRNNGYRTITSIELSVQFLNSSGDIIHIEKVQPLKTSIMPKRTTIAALSLFTSGKEVPMLPGESIRFKHILSEQKDKDLISPIKNNRYGTNPNEWSGKLSQTLTRIKF
ncbi:MAG: hypothetical protein ABH875_04145 [Candidatus Omnitrophota bacterium]